jgi:hypothetical protein
MIHEPAFTPYQYVNTPKSESDTGIRNLVHMGFEWFIQEFAFRLLVPTRSTLQADIACPLNADSILIDEMADELFALRRP